MIFWVLVSAVLSVPLTGVEVIAIFHDYTKCKQAEVRYEQNSPVVGKAYTCIERR